MLTYPPSIRTLNWLGSEARLVGEIDIRAAVQKTVQIHSRPFQMDRVDSEVTPIERTVGVVMIDFTVAARFSARWIANATRPAEPNLLHAYFWYAFRRRPD